MTVAYAVWGRWLTTNAVICTVLSRGTSPSCTEDGSEMTKSAEGRGTKAAWFGREPSGGGKPLRSPPMNLTPVTWRWGCLLQEPVKETFDGSGTELGRFLLPPPGLTESFCMDML